MNTDNAGKEDPGVENVLDVIVDLKEYAKQRERPPPRAIASASTASAPGVPTSRQWDLEAHTSKIVGLTRSGRLPGAQVVRQRNFGGN
jgi:hypothetical protein